MRFINLTLSTPTQNLALDEALLDHCESKQGDECLRLWECQEHFIVLGYSKLIAQEVLRSACEKDSIAILRRSSGGGTVVQGPGCLNYSLILKNPSDAPFSSIRQSTDYVMSRNRQIFEKLLGEPVKVQGFSDLTYRDKKFSGNAQRKKRHYYLFHGTVLYNFDIQKMAHYLSHPIDKPAYRQDRVHGDFAMNIPTSKTQIIEALQQGWDAHHDSTRWAERLDLSAYEKLYQSKEFIEKF